jgi:hypothetical protein
MNLVSAWNGTSPAETAKKRELAPYCTLIALSFLYIVLCADKAIEKTFI